MKPFLSAVALLLVSNVQAQNSFNQADIPPKNNKPKFLEGDEASYDIKAPCGKCIASGYNFCWKSEETGLIVTDDRYPDATGIFETTSTLCCGEESWY